MATFLITVATVRERQGQGLRPVSLALRPYVGALEEQRQALRYLAVLFLSGVGINTIQANLTRCATHVLGVSDSAAVTPFLIVTLVLGLVTVPAARVARRIGIKWVIASGMVLIAVAAGAALVVQTAGQVAPVFILTGAGRHA